MLAGWLHRIGPEKSLCRAPNLLSLIELLGQLLIRRNQYAIIDLWMIAKLESRFLVPMDLGQPKLTSAVSPSVACACVNQLAPGLVIASPPRGCGKNAGRPQKAETCLFPSSSSPSSFNPLLPLLLLSPLSQDTHPPKASVVMQRLSYPTETVLSNKMTRNRIVLSFKDSPRKPLGRRPLVRSCFFRFSVGNNAAASFFEVTKSRPDKKAPTFFCVSVTLLFSFLFLSRGESRRDSDFARPFFQSFPLFHPFLPSFFLSFTPLLPVAIVA